MTDQDSDQSSSGDSLGRVLQIFKEIAEKSADGDLPLPWRTRALLSRVVEPLPQT